MKTYFILILFFYSCTIFSQTENHIDLKLEKCLNAENLSTADMRQCEIDAYEAWNKELNKYYNLLKQKLSKQSFEKLKKSHQEWIKYRDAEFEFISEYYLTVKQGTMWHPVSDDKKMQIVKQRALELKEYYDSIEY